MQYTTKRILKHLIAFVLIVIVLIVALLIGLRKYTQQDSAVTVPDVTSLSVENAIPFLEKKGLRYKVVDSVHVETCAPGVILEQKPAPGSSVKQNRFVFLIVNSVSEEQIIFPDVKDFSQRQAVATLEAAGLRIASIEFMPSEYRDLVLGVRYQGKTVAAGARLPKRSAVVLIVGQGDGGQEITVPSLHGLSLNEANVLAHENSLSININYDVTPASTDEARKYRIYRQKPITGSTTASGKSIDVWMTTDPDLLSEPDEVYQEEADYIEN
jgi:eukaryotic-like serine/threonine-protein kinase